MGRNDLKGALGDAINLLLAASAWNLSLWMRRLLVCLLAFLAAFLPAPKNHPVYISQPPIWLFKERLWKMEQSKTNRLSRW
jgi:hypothetical protein